MKTRRSYLSMTNEKWYRYYSSGGQSSFHPVFSLFSSRTPGISATLSCDQSKGAPRLFVIFWTTRTLNRDWKRCSRARQTINRCDGPYILVTPLFVLVDTRTFRGKESVPELYLISFYGRNISPGT